MNLEHILKLAPTAVSGIAILGGVAILWSVTYNLFFSPLRNIPGPFICKITSAYITYFDLTHVRHLKVHELHKKYGPVLRVAPDELSFNNLANIKEIYGQSSTLRKAKVYLALGRKTIFTMLDHEEHKERRRLISHSFSASSVNDAKGIILEHVDKLCMQLEQRAGADVDFLLWIRRKSFDVSGALFLGHSFGALESDQPHPYINDLDNMFPVMMLEHTIPLIVKIMQNIAPQKIRHYLGAVDRVYNYSAQGLEKYLALYGRNSSRKDILSKMLALSVDEKNPMTDKDVAEEVQTLIFGGTDTESTAVTYCFWLLSKHKHIQEELFAQIQKFKEAHSDAGERVDYASPDSPPLLEAVILETMRLYPPGPGAMPRESQSGGAMIGGMLVPDNTVVSMQAYSTHRIPSIFPSPDTFNPSRWTETHGGTSEMKEAFLAFQTGRRNCIGQALAMTDMKITVGNLVERFEVSLAQGQRDEDMQLNSQFAAFPKGEKCLLVFDVRKKQ